ncbi:dihydropyrimidinase-like, partial [Olea europaea var. sylvestris]|uniref:dihydropyrimidinase-like n=1 Tax=Olea europaea var. sylvestris TaxID=158386 RepID=UPI000C1D787C
MDSKIITRIFHSIFLLSLFSSVSESHQFCDAGIGYCESEYGVASGSSSKILIKGGTVVNSHLQEVADVYIEDGIVAAVQSNIKVIFLIILISS